MRVLCIAFNSGELSIRLASALAQEAEVCLMLPWQQASPHLRWLSPNLNFQPFDKPRLRQPWQQLRTMAMLLKRIRQFEPDVIHLQKGHLYFSLILPLLRRYPLVISIHDPRQHVGDKASRKTPQAVMDFAYRRADRVIVHNEQMKQVTIDHLRIPPEKIHITALIERGDANIQNQVQEEGRLVLFFGRIWKYKGLEYLIRAEPLITAQVPEAKIIIAGQGDDFVPYRQMMVHPENFIVHNEFVSDDKRAELFRRSSVVALPYIEATQSGVIPVAYTHARPVVATTVGGLPEQVEHGRTGFLVPARDEKALAEAIVRLLQDEKLRHQLGKNGRQKLEKEWAAQIVARQTLAVYRGAIDAVNSRRSRGNKLETALHE